MDPVWVLLWAMLALYAGFFVGWLVPGRYQERWRQAYELWQQLKLDDGRWRLDGPWHEYARDVIFGLAVLTGMVGFGLGCGVLLGNPWGAATVLVWAFAVGLAWGASQWLPKHVRILIREGNCWHPSDETWSERMARWGFPNREQIGMASFREDLRGRLSRYTCTCRACSS